MKRSVGIVAAVIVFLIALVLILQIWGVVHISFFSFLKMGATWIILLGALIAFVVIYGMFFWKGSDLSMREQRELKKKQEEAASNSGRASDTR